MDGVLNETTLTVHRRGPEATRLGSECGATRNLPADRLHAVPVELAGSRTDVTKCGRCFEDGGGY